MKIDTLILIILVTIGLVILLMSFLNRFSLIDVSALKDIIIGFNLIR